MRLTLAVMNKNYSPEKLMLNPFEAIVVFWMSGGDLRQIV